MEVNFIGKPGNSNIINSTKKRITKADEYLELEDKRFKYIWKGITKLKEIEDEKLGISGLVTKQGGELVNFRLIKETQILKEGQTQTSYTKN